MSEFDRDRFCYWLSRPNHERLLIAGLRSQLGIDEAGAKEIIADLANGRTKPQRKTTATLARLMGLRPGRLLEARDG